MTTSTSTWWWTRELNHTKSSLPALEAFVCLYKSTSGSWQCQAFSEAIPFGPQVRPHALVIFLGGVTPYSYEAATRLVKEEFSDVPSSLVGGKVYYAELEFDGTSMPIFFPRPSDIHTRGLIRLFEVDHEAGTWKPTVRYAKGITFLISLPLREFGM